jgi:hypothetical protein
MEIRNIDNIFKVKELLACWYTDVNLDLAVTLNVGIAVASKNGIDLIELLEGVLVESVEVIIDINRRAAV